MKACKAVKEGWLTSEITPYKTKIIDKDGKEKEVEVKVDEGMRPETTIEGLAKLKPSFKKGGTTTAGNSS